MMINIVLVFLSFLKIGSIAFGGGYAMIPVIMNEVVTVHHWISQQEFLTIVVLSQVTPGPIATSAATYVGYRVAGLPGAIAAMVGVITFSVGATTLLSTKLLKHRESPKLQMVFATLNPIVLALIVSAGIGTGTYVKPVWQTGVIVGLTVLWLWRVKGQSHWLMLICAGLGFLLFR